MDLVRVDNAGWTHSLLLSVYMVRTAYTKALQERLPQKKNPVAQTCLVVALWPKLSMRQVLWAIQGLVHDVL